MTKKEKLEMIQYAGKKAGLYNLTEQEWAAFLNYLKMPHPRNAKRGYADYIHEKVYRAILNDSFQSERIWPPDPRDYNGSYRVMALNCDTITELLNVFVVYAFRTPQSEKTYKNLVDYISKVKEYGVEHALDDEELSLSYPQYDEVDVNAPDETNMNFVSQQLLDADD